MAYQPEQPNYDVGVYQIETTDPVDGGVGSITNSPLLNLADRTAYLYQHVTNLENGTTQPPGMATLNSPDFTGTPTTPTPPGGDSSTKIANTIWTQGLLHGVSTINCAGSANVVLTAAQAGVGVLELTGILTGNISVVVPNSTGMWVVSNQATGAFTITVKTASGTGIVVAQGLSNELWSDGINVYPNRTDFTGITLNGATVNTAPAGDQSLKIANTNFAYNLKNGVVNVPVGGAANVALTAAQYGSGILLLTGALTASIEVFVPAQGGTYVVANNTTGAFSLTMGVNGSGGKTALIPQGQSVIVYSDGTNTILAGAAASSSFNVQSFTATAGQTTFNMSYTPGNILVTQNGATVSAVNYTASNGSSITINSTVTTGDEVVIYAFASFTVANAVTWAGGAMVGALQLAGGDTGTTAPQFDNTIKLATTAFVKKSGLQMAGLGNGFGANTTLTAAQLNNWGSFGVAGVTVTMPTVASTTPGSTFTFIGGPNGGTIAGNGADLISNAIGGSAGTLKVSPGETVTVINDGSGFGWYAALGGCTTSAFINSITVNGYQKLPSGLIIQWVAADSSGTASGNLAITWPIAFPNQTLIVTGMTTAGNCIGSVVTSSKTGTSITTYSASTGAVTSGQGMYVVGLGF